MIKAAKNRYILKQLGPKAYASWDRDEAKVMAVFPSRQKARDHNRDLNAMTAREQEQAVA